MATRVCVGCGCDLTGKTASREHVLPQWLAEEIAMPRVDLKHYHHDGEVESDALLRSHGLNNFAVKNVCRGCNNGWMSRLEDQAKPLILGLMNLKASLLQLADSERAALSMWAAKTAFMIASVQTAQLKLPWHLFESLSSDEQVGPDGCFVLSTQLPFLPNGFLYSCPTDALTVDGPPVQVRVGFSIRHLSFVTVIPIVEAPRVIRVAAGVHVPIWSLDLEARCRWIPFPTMSSPGELISVLTNLVEAGIARDI
jgi:hypothetical protein